MSVIIFTILYVYRRKEESQRLLAQRRRELEHAQLQEEELAESKKSLCDQLQLLVEDSNRSVSLSIIAIVCANIHYLFTEVVAKSYCL